MEPPSPDLEGRPPILSPVVVAAGVGAAWGAVGYAVLWGETSIVTNRAFVVSPLGTIAFLPVRVMLWAIHLAEDVAGRPFELSASHWWIGAASAGVGAALLGGLAWAVRAAVRRHRTAA